MCQVDYTKSIQLTLKEQNMHFSPGDSVHVTSQLNSHFKTDMEQQEFYYGNYGNWFLTWFMTDISVMAWAYLHIVDALQKWSKNK